MSTTTIRLPDTLKTRVAQAAKRSGKTAHSFILEAIAEKTEQEEKRSDLYAVAEQRYGSVADSGTAIGWDEMRRYMEARAEGRPAKRPAAKKLAR